MRVTLVEALGALAPDSPALLDQVLAALDAEVVRDGATRTHCRVLTCTALRAFGRLAGMLPSVAPRARSLLSHHMRAAPSHHVAVAAAETLIDVVALDRSQEALLATAADIVDALDTPAAQVATLTAAFLQLQRLATLKKVRGRPHAGKPASLATIARVHMRMGRALCPTVRHAAFRLFSAALGSPASLVSEEGSAGTEGPSRSPTAALRAQSGGGTLRSGAAVPSGSCAPSGAPSGVTGGATVATGGTGRRRIVLRNPNADGVTSRRGTSPEGAAAQAAGDAADAPTGAAAADGAPVDEAPADEAPAAAANAPAAGGARPDAAGSGAASPRVGSAGGGLETTDAVPGHKPMDTNTGDAGQAAGQAASAAVELATAGQTSGGAVKRESEAGVSAAEGDAGNASSPPHKKAKKEKKEKKDKKEKDKSGKKEKKEKKEKKDKSEKKRSKDDKSAHEREASAQQGS